MTRPGLDLLSRDDFAAFSLHEKNAYLQDLADRYAALNDRDRVVLDRDALSRLRRYYSRRVWADLKIAPDDDTPVERALRRLGEAIRNSQVREDVVAALAQETRSRKVLRTAPADDAQLMFFVPAIHDAPIKDDVNLMDIAPFSLSKKTRLGTIRYELKDCLITIEGGAETGLATVFDYDIFLNMVSALADEVRRYRMEDGKGLRPSMPSKVYRPNAAHILKFCRRSSGGRQYEEIEDALARLSKTTIKVTNLSGGRRRQVDSRPLIGEYTVVSKTGTGRVDEIEITIPDWVYLTIVRSEKTLPLLTLHEDYFLISSGLGRFLYRLARKAAGKGDARYSAKEIHKRSGSPQEYRFFLRDLREIVGRTQAFPMPDYELFLEEGKDGTVLYMRQRSGEAGDGGEGGDGVDPEGAALLPAP